MSDNKETRTLDTAIHDVGASYQARLTVNPEIDTRNAEYYAEYGGTPFKTDPFQPTWDDDGAESYHVRPADRNETTYLLELKSGIKEYIGIFGRTMQSQSPSPQPDEEFDGDPHGMFPETTRRVDEVKWIGPEESKPRPQHQAIKDLAHNKADLLRETYNAVDTALRQTSEPDLYEPANGMIRDLYASGMNDRLFFHNIIQDANDQRNSEGRLITLSNNMDNIIDDIREARFNGHEYWTGLAKKVRDDDPEH